MSEQLQAAEEAVQSDMDGAAAQSPDANLSEVQQPSPSRPAGVPEKFWDGEAGCIRTDALLKSYLEIERKLGSMIALPAGEADQEGYSRLHRALGVPDSADGYQIAARSELLEPSPEINARLHELLAQSESNFPLSHDQAADLRTNLRDVLMKIKVMEEQAVDLLQRAIV